MLSELPVVYSDCQRKMYRPSAYILAKGVAEVRLDSARRDDANVQAVQDVALPFLHTTVYYWMAGLSYDIHQYLRMVVVSIFETFIACSVGYAAACIFGDLHRASYAVVMLSLPMMLLSGFFIDFSSIPAVLQPFAYLSWFRYGYMVSLLSLFNYRICFRLIWQLCSRRRRSFPAVPKTVPRFLYVSMHMDRSWSRVGEPTPSTRISVSSP